MEQYRETSIPATCDGIPKVLYLDNEELRSFVASTDNSIEGVSYEWEGEGVVHLHTAPIKHAFGRVGKVLYKKSEDYSVVQELCYKDYNFIVLVNAEVQAKVYVTINGKLTQCNAELIPARTELYSRSKGILEVGALAEKRVVIIGLGSFGSQIAIELAKAGVGHFALMDFDRVELHNLMRHTCVANELGRLKTDAIYDAVLGKNPYAQVDRFPININEHIDLLETEIRKSDIVICATDNNQSRFNISKVLDKVGRIGIFGRAVTRAEGGDVSIHRPGEACYCCFVGNDWYDRAAEEVTNETSARRDGRIAAYVSAEEADAIVQVGLSSDIEPICNMIVKITLMELSRGLDTGISSLEGELVHNYYMWANRREKRYANWAPLASAGSKPTIMRWYGARIPRDPGCALCSKTEIEFEDTSAVEEMLQHIQSLNEEADKAQNSNEVQ